MNVKFQNLENEKIRQCFFQVLDQYESLRDHEIIVSQQRISSSTMQAQPVIRLKSIFSRKKIYKVKVAVYVRDSKKIKVEDLDEDVLVGWFAHELGHLVDYKPYGNISMIGFGLKYLFYPKFKRKVEHAADYIAIEKGFKSEILASKRFLLESGFIDEKYIKKISKFYLPISAVELCPEGEVVLPSAKL